MIKGKSINLRYRFRNMKQSLVLLTFSIILIACGQKKSSNDIVHAQKSDTTEQKPKINISEEDKCISLVDTLPEIFSLRNNIEITTKNLNSMVIWVYANPSETKIKYYWVKVGEDNRDNIATIYNFYVDPKLEEVLFYDVVNDNLITLEEWRNENLKE